MNSRGGAVGMDQTTERLEDPPMMGCKNEEGKLVNALTSCCSGVPPKSDRFEWEPLSFSPEPGPTSKVQDPEDIRTQALDRIFMRLEEDVLTFVKEQLKSFHRLLASEHPESISESLSERQESNREAVLRLTLDFLSRMDQEHLAQCLKNKSVASMCIRDLKTHLQQKFSQVFEGVAKVGDTDPLQQIILTVGRDSEVNQEHEVRLIEIASKKPAERTIKCEDMVKLQSESEQPIRATLSMGVAGVGKTMLTQKFSLDWAEGRANQDVQLLFLFTFRELNVLRDREFSLVGLLHHCFSQTKRLCNFEDLEVLFIFDGLDECRLPLDFGRTRVLTEPTESASVEELLVNLIRGSLLPSSRLWITTRPAAANQIPAWCVSMVNEVQGFTDDQKVLYFRNRLGDDAHQIISHIKSIHTLNIMSYIPIFNWMLSIVLQNILEQTLGSHMPRTLTELYVYFLMVQVKVKYMKYDERREGYHYWNPETKEMVRSLGKLAFEQLQKGNLIFYESDLIECGLDATAASVYSGVFTEVFREESSLYQNKVYYFIHLSVQEFLAALFVHQTFYSSGENLLSPPQSSESSGSTTIIKESTSLNSILKTLKLIPTISESPEGLEASLLSSKWPNPVTFYCSAVDRALQSPKGHLDLFLRFLLGLSLPTNQNRLWGFLTPTVSDWTNYETVAYITQKLNEEGLSAERSLNLLHCLNELNNHSLLEQIQKIMREGGLSDKRVTPAQWSALSFLLLSSDSDLEIFDLHKYCASEDAFMKLLPILKVSNTALLHCCGLSPRICAPLASVLSSSSLTQLDLSDNDLLDSGVELLCEGLKSTACRLEELMLSGCLISERGGASLASALSSAPSFLRSLDLSYNHLGDSTELLTTLSAPCGPLDTLRLEPSGAQWLTPGLQKYYMALTLDQNTANGFLQLSDNGRTVTSVREEQRRPEHPDRCEWPQVLSSTALRGRCYYEVQWSGGFVDIAVNYKGIKRRGHMRECEFGADHQSWSLRVSVNGFSVHHNNQKTAVFSSAMSGCSQSVPTFPSGLSPRPSGSPLHQPLPSHQSLPSPRMYSSGRVGVFLDSDSLSFFDVSGCKTLLYTFNTVFTEPVFAGFWLLNPGSSVSLVDVTKHPQETSITIDDV